MAEKEINFEKELNRLNEIVEQIQSDSIPLNDALKFYEEGNKIIALLNEELQKAEEKIEQIVNINK